ncbi:MAG TPA: hypothetical protein VIM10_00260 [Actinopolymorphaceae bacterium]|jgi:hypothetical protein
MTVQTLLAPAGIEPVLTEAEITQFDDLGYVIVKGRSTVARPSTSAT